MRFLCSLFAVAALSACGGSPTRPNTAQPPQQLPPAGWTVSGSLVDTLSGVGIGGATMTFADRPPVTTSPVGLWTLQGTGIVSSARMSVSITAPGYLGRESAVLWNTAGRNDVRLDLIEEAAPFTLGYYRELVRNGLETPETLEPLRRWTTTPSFYIDITNPKSGGTLTPSEVDLIQQVIRDTVPQLTGGLLVAGAIEIGTTRQPERVGFIDVIFVHEPEGDYCGKAFVGRNPGLITMNFDRCRTSCGAFSPETLAHEIGHAMGFYHTSRNDIMNTATRVRRCPNTLFSEDERYHARLAYKRPRGSLDIDRDPSSFSAIQAGEAGNAPLVICRTR
jgi:hypothetical protein